MRTGGRPRNGEPRRRTAARQCQGVLKDNINSGSQGRGPPESNQPPSATLPMYSIGGVFGVEQVARIRLGTPSALTVASRKPQLPGVGL